MDGKSLTDDTRCWINEHITILRGDLDNLDLESLKKLQAEIRADSVEHDLRRLNHSDFMLVLEYERILSDSIAVSTFLFRTFKLSMTVTS